MVQTYPNLLAKSLTVTDVPAPFELFAGDSEVVTDQGQAGGSNIAQFAVLGRITATNRWVVVAPAASDGSQIARAIAAQPIAANAMGPIYVGGIFNHEALIWPAAWDLLSERKAAFDGTPIGVRALL